MPRKPRLPATVKEEQRKQCIEQAAIAAYRMEQGKYAYPPGVPRGHKKPDGTHEWNKSELLRVFGHKHPTHPEALFDDPHFWRMVEYQRWRGSDPMFRMKVQNQVWHEIGSEVSMSIYERVKFRREAMSLSDEIKIMRLIVDAGIRLGSKDAKNRSNELLAGMNDEDRARLLKEQEHNAEQTLLATRRLRLANEGANEVEGELDE